MVSIGFTAWLAAGSQTLAQQTPPPAAAAFAPLPDAPKVDEARAKLGLLLFFDNRLSGDTGNACSTCHDPAKGWGDGKPLSTGYTGVEHFRNAPGLFNVASRKRLTWDGRLDGSDLPTTVRDMLTEAHTMNADTRIVQERLKQAPEYAQAFKDSFGGDPYGGSIYGAIGEYLKTIRTKDAPFDKFLRGDQAALTDQQKTGMDLFKGKAGCIACHNGPLMSDGKAHALGVPEHPDMAANALRQITMLRHYASMGVPDFMNRRTDIGTYSVSKDDKDTGKFQTPSLWDVGRTAPYMHNGVLNSLAEVLEFYDKGGGPPSQMAELKPLGLTVGEKAAIVAFLESFSGAEPSVTVPKLPDYAIREVGKN